MAVPPVDRTLQRTVRSMQLPVIKEESPEQEIKKIAAEKITGINQVERKRSPTPPPSGDKV